MARLITPGGDVSDIIPFDSTFSLGELMDAVGGRCKLFPVCYVSEGVRCQGWLVVNPNGTSQGLKANAAATMIVRNAGYDEVVAGDVLLCRQGEIR